MTKKIVAIIAVLITVFLPCAVLASGSEQNIPDFWGEAFVLSISSEKTDYLNKATAKQVVEFKNGLVAELSLSVTDVVERDFSSFSAKAAKKYTSSLKIKNALGITILTLNAVGIFDFRGTVTIPIDAYGFCSNASVSNPENHLGPDQFNSWVKVRFSGSLPYNNMLFSYTCTINCDAYGNSSANWQ